MRVEARRNEAIRRATRSSVLRGWRALDSLQVCSLSRPLALGRSALLSRDPLYPSLSRSLSLFAPQESLENSVKVSSPRRVVSLWGFEGSFLFSTPYRCLPPPFCALQLYFASLSPFFSFLVTTTSEPPLVIRRETVRFRERASARLSSRTRLFRSLFPGLSRFFLFLCVFLSPVRPIAMAIARLARAFSPLVVHKGLKGSRCARPSLAPAFIWFSLKCTKESYCRVRLSGTRSFRALHNDNCWQ